MVAVVVRVDEVAKRTVGESCGLTLTRSGDLAVDSGIDQERGFGANDQPGVVAWYRMREKGVDVLGERSRAKANSCGVEIGSDGLDTARTIVRQ